MTVDSPGVLDQCRVHGNGWGIRVGWNRTRPGQPIVIEIVLAGDDPAAQAFRFALSRFLRGIFAAWQTWLSASAAAGEAEAAVKERDAAQPKK